MERSGLVGSFCPSCLSSGGNDPYTRGAVETVRITSLQTGNIPYFCQYFGPKKLLKLLPFKSKFSIYHSRFCESFIETINELFWITEREVDPTEGVGGWFTKALSVTPRGKWKPSVAPLTSTQTGYNELCVRNRASPS